jgi:hypothetical protein
MGISPTSYSGEYGFRTLLEYGYPDVFHGFPQSNCEPRKYLLWMTMSSLQKPTELPTGLNLRFMMSELLPVHRYIIR